MKEGRPKIGEPFNPHQKLYQIHVPLGMVESGLFSPIALIIYGRLQLYKAKDECSCFVYRETLANALKISIPKVDRAIAELRSNRVIKVERRGKGAENEYIFIYSPLLDDSAPVRSQTIHQPKVETTNSEPYDSAPVQTQEAYDSASMRSQDSVDSAQVRTQGGVDSAKTTPLTLQNSSVDSAKVGVAYKEKRFLKDSLKDSSSSSVPSNGTGSGDDDDDVSNVPKPKPNAPPPEVVVPIEVEHSDEDVAEFGEFMQKSLDIPETERYYGKFPDPPRVELVREILALAPGWTVEQLKKALDINATESPGRPKGYGWFKTVVVDVYRNKRKGIPPDLPQKKVIVQEPPRPEPRCQYCRDTGIFHNQLCPWECDAAKRERVELELKDREEAQSGRWHALYRKCGDGMRMEMSEAGDAFLFNNDLDLRDRVLELLESGVHYSDITKDGKRKSATQESSAA